MIDGVVTQLDSCNSIVIKCTACGLCIKQNPDAVPGGVKKCQLSVDHGNRCFAYPQDAHVFMIDTDTNKIKQLPS